MLNLCALGQSVTTDSVTIPRRWFRAASADLVRFDNCKEEIGLLKPRLANAQQLNILLARDTTLKAERIAELDARLIAERKLSGQIEANCNAAMKDYAKQLKRQRRAATWRCVGIGVGALGAGYLLHSLVK